VLFSHGRGSNAAASLPILSHLASYGFVVVGPDHQDCASACHDPDDFIAEAARRPDDIVAVLEHLLALSAGGQDPVLTNLLDPARVGVAGASLGGFTALKVMEIDSRVRGAVLLAPGPTWPDPFNPTIAPPDPRNVRQPVMFIAGTLDTQVPFEATAQFFSDIPADAPERWFVEIRSAGHMLGQSHCIDFTPFIRCPELLPSSAANGIVARWATVFLLRHIAGETQLDGYLDATANKDAGVAVIHASPGGQTPQIVSPPIRTRSYARQSSACVRRTQAWPARSCAAVRPCGSGHPAPRLLSRGSQAGQSSSMAHYAMPGRMRWPLN
jgi:pimeloyl-ACP methyl ester carboxylesterase